MSLFKRSPNRTPRPPIQVGRWLFHALLLFAFAASGAALLIWPQWVAVEGARAGLEVQRERQDDLEERIELVRALTGRLRTWQREGRKVFSQDEVARYPALAREIAGRNGARVLAVNVADRATNRWKSVSQQAGVWANADRAGAGDIRPYTVRVVLAGGFAETYRTVGWLSQQQQLFVPDRWEIRPEKNLLRATIVGTVFVVEEPDTPVPPALKQTAGPDSVALPEKREGRG